MEPTDQVRQEVGRQGIAGREVEGLGPLSVGFAGGAQRFFQERLEARGVGKQGFACRGQPNPPALPLDQGESQLGFQGAHLLGHRWLAEIELRRGAGKAPGGRDGVKRQ